MPEKVIRDGISYLEYTPQELDKIRLDNFIGDMVKRGRFYGGTDAPVYPSTNVGRTTPLPNRFRRNS